MDLKPLINTKLGQPLKVGILMSGLGTNAEKIIEFEKTNPDCNFKVSLIFSDNPDSRAKEIGQKNNIPYEIFSIKEFFKAHPELKRFSLKDRVHYDKEVAKILGRYNIDLLAYAGYMNITTKPVISQFLGINVHPADLSIKDETGKRKLIGEQSVKNAIKQGLKEIASTTHIVTLGVDQGPILMISKPLKVIIPKDKDIKANLDEITDLNQNRLKEQGDWIIFPKTIALIAQGKIEQDSKGTIYYEKRPIPNGIRL